MTTTVTLSHLHQDILDMKRELHSAINCMLRGRVFDSEGELTDELVDSLRRARTQPRRIISHDAIIEEFG